MKWLNETANESNYFFEIDSAQAISHFVYSTNNIILKDQYWARPTYLIYDLTYNSDKIPRYSFGKMLPVKSKHEHFN